MINRGLLNICMFLAWFNRLIQSVTTGKIKMRILKFYFVVICATLSLAAQAAVVQTSTITVVDPSSSGQIQVKSTVFDQYLGDFTKWHFVYEITNLSYDPNPGASNGLSGFNLVFGAPTPSTANQSAPLGWVFNCCGTIPPFGAEYDIRNSSGFGIPIGAGADIGFTTAAGVPLSNIHFGSWAHSWVNDSQTSTFNLQDIASGLGPIVPGVPVPAAVWLFGSGLIGLIGIARRKTS